MTKFNRLLVMAVVMVMLLSVFMPSSLLALGRHSGDNRYETAVEISKAGWEAGSDVVIIARGDNFADALAGVPLAHKFMAPVLLTRPKALPEATLAEIQRLGASQVYILGKEGAVSAAIETQLADLGLAVLRIGGDNRYDTAAKIARELAPGGTGTAFVVYGQNFPDALAAASYAAAGGHPILLTGTDTLHQLTAQALEDLGVENTFVVGGTGVISNRVMAELPNPERIAGKNRYLTALALAERFASSSHMFIATGTDESGGADAIAGGALAASQGTGILLVSNIVPAEVLEFLGMNVERAEVFGGSAAVSSEVAQAIQDALYVPADDEEPSTPVTPVPVGTISITGDAVVGATLTAQVTPSGATVTYQWQSSADEVNWDDISGRTSKTYVLSEEDGGKYIRVNVTGTGNYTGTKTSDSIGPVEAVINDRLSITGVSINDNGAYNSTAKGSVRVLGYGVGINLDAQGEGKKVSDTTSIVIELYKGNTLLGLQTFNEAGYNKHGAINVISGTIDAGGQYVSTSWDNSWSARIDQIPDKAIATVRYTDGIATAEMTLNLTEEQTKIFYAAEAVHSLFEDVFADTESLALKAGVTQETVNAASLLVEAVTRNPAENKAVLQGLVNEAKKSLAIANFEGQFTGELPVSVGDNEFATITFADSEFTVTINVPTATVGDLNGSGLLSSIPTEKGVIKIDGKPVLPESGGFSGIDLMSKFEGVDFTQGYNTQLSALNGQAVGLEFTVRIDAFVEFTKTYTFTFAVAE